MRICLHLSSLPTAARGAVVALGNFDGVHRGHGAVIGTAAGWAGRLGCPLGVLTFEPHPRAVFQPGLAPFRLTPLRNKARALAQGGVDLLYVARFDRQFLHQSAEDFIDRVLVGGLAARVVVAGTDFRFGHRRTGDLALLARHGAPAGLTVVGVDAFRDADGGTVSSTRVRAALQDGDPGLAARLLGRPWEIEGRVVEGDRLGRQLGFPTANVRFGAFLRPRFGVYAVRVALEGWEEGPLVWRPGVANLGRRPTLNGLDERMEVHLFDFAGSLYGRRLRVQLHSFLRGEQKFSDLEALKVQIALDAAAARRVLEGD